jgi:hypothetical protein
MAYSALWTEAVPVGSLSASDIDQAIRDAKRDIRERVAGLFGIPDFTVDPLVAQSLSLGANPAQSGSLRVANNVGAVVARNAANSADIILSKLTAANIVEIAGAKLTVDPATGDTVIAGAAGVGGTALTIKSANPTGAAINFLVPDNWSWDFRRKAALGGSALLILDTGVVQVSNERLNLSASTVNFPTLSWPDGVLPTIPLVEGMMWRVAADLFIRQGGVTKKVTFV